VIAINAPCGTGKSAIAKAIMEEFPDAVYMTPNNMLVHQLAEFYPDVNVLIGKKHYTCTKDSTMSCELAMLRKGHRQCKECPYLQAREAYLLGHRPTAFNPISYWYAQKDSRWKKPSVVIVDEADKLIEMLMLISGDTFGSKYKPPRNLNDLIEVADWLKSKLEVLSTLVYNAPAESADKYLGELDKVQRVLSAIELSPENFVFENDDKGDLVIFPTDPPRRVIEDLLNADHIVLMSATLYRSDVEEITNEYSYLELDSPIDEARRRIIVSPSVVRFNWKTDPVLIADWIREQMIKYPSRNTIAHVTYEDAKKLKKYFKEAYVHTPETKKEVLREFKEKGGLWLASGVHEGIDLPDELCTLNLIPRLPRANITDPIIKRRLARAGGQRGYDISVLKVLQQAAGRTTRHEEDYSTVVVADASFLTLIKKYKHLLPKSFLEAIHEHN
jgi:hypothetical protein